MLILGPLVLVASAQETVPPADSFDLRMTPEVRVVQEVAPAVVFIETDIRTPVRDIFGQLFMQERRGGGTGVVLFDDGYIVTNNHVVLGAATIRVRFDPDYDERVYEAELISAVPAEDLALLKISRDEPFTTVRMGTSSDLMIGERVLAIGNPYGQSNTVSAGIISGLHRDVPIPPDPPRPALRLTDLIQTDAAINSGNSGGPLLNILGELIGINCAMNYGAENIGFSIPVNTVKRVLEEHLLDPDAARAWLGYDVDLDTLEVTRVVGGGPADAAGLAPGDRVTAFDGRPVADGAAYRLARAAAGPGRPLELSVSRGLDQQTLQMEPWPQANGILFDRLGLTVQGLVIGSAGRPRPAVRILSVREAGPAARIGIQVGDILDAARPENRRTQILGTPEELALLAQRFPAGTRFLVDLWRDENANNQLERTDTYSELFSGYLTLE